MKILEANVDDIGLNGVYALVCSIIKNRPTEDTVDIAAYEHFENPDDIKKLSSIGCNVFYVGYEGNKIAKQFVCLNNLISLIKSGKYNCVHIHSDVAYKPLVMGLAARFAGCEKIVLHSHASNVDGQHFRWLKTIAHKLCRPLLKFIGTDFITCSDLAGQWMFPNIPAKQLTFLKNGIDIDSFRLNTETRQRIREAIGAKGKFVVGHVGRFAYQKNHEFLLKVFQKVKQTTPDATLLLIGKGELTDAIKRQAKSLGITESVIFYGPADNVNELMQAMDVFVLPSHLEGLPIVGVEAQAAGLPCIFSDRVTREVNLTGNVQFLPISDPDVTKWASAIAATKGRERSDTSPALKESDFSVTDTVKTLWKVYKR